MKKIVSALLLVSFLALPVGVFGAAPPDDAPDIDVMDALANIVNWVFGILLIVAAMFMIFGAFTYITASGDPEKIKTAHNSIMYALVGVAVAILAKGLVSLVEKIVTPV